LERSSRIDPGMLMALLPKLSPYGKVSEAIAKATQAGLGIIAMKVMGGVWFQPAA